MMKPRIVVVCKIPPSIAREEEILLYPGGVTSDWKDLESK